MEVSLDRSYMTCAPKQRAEIRLFSNNCDACIDGLKRFDVQQVEQTDWMMTIGTMRHSFVNQVEDDSHQCDRFT